MSVLALPQIVRLLTRHRMLADAEFFRSHISKMDGAGDLGKNVYNVVSTKPIISNSNATASALLDKKPSEQRADHQSITENEETAE